MLRDKSGRAVPEITITEFAFNEIKKAVKEHIPELLDAADILLCYGANPVIAAGLYTYAVEEYGKALILNSCKPSAGMVTLPYGKGFVNHTVKFEKALNQLPANCKLLHRGSFSDAFSSESFDVDEVADCQARLNVFYSDLRNSSDRAKRPPSVDVGKLKKAIATLRPIASNL